MEIQQIIILSKEFQGKGEIFLSGELLRGNPRDIKKALETGNSLRSDPVGEPGGGFVYCGLLRDR